MGNQTVTTQQNKQITGSYLTGLGNTDWNIQNPDYVSGRAATEDQLKVISDTIKDTKEDLGKKQFGLKDQEGKAVKKNLNDTITVKGGNTEDTTISNITTKVNDQNELEIALKKEIDLGKDGQIQTGNTTVNNDGVTVNDGKGNVTTVEAEGITITNGDSRVTVDGSGLKIDNGPSMTTGGIDAGSKKITNVADGTADSDAVNLGQLKKSMAESKTVVADGKNTKVTGSGTEKDPYRVNVKDQMNLGAKDGEDGKIGVNGKDGSAVVINGKDGSIGLNGKNGSNGLTIKGDKGTVGVDGTDGANGKDGMTRIVYEDSKGTKHEVATMNDGLKFTGNNSDMVNNHKLNSLVTIKGEGVSKADSIGFQSASGNINIKANGTDTLEVQLNKNLKGINTITNGSSSITLHEKPNVNTNTPAVTITGGDLNMGGSKITNIASGKAKTDAATVGQLTQVTSNNNSVKVVESTNADGAKVYDLAVQGLDPRVDRLAEEIGNTGAQSAALAALKPLQYDPLEPTQIMAGYGYYQGSSALALGLAHYKNESMMLHGGISWAGGSSHVMANAGITWKIGSRDSELAVADRYRKGPISSTYAMQNEIAAMKAENVGLKNEVADLQAENEQMKAQIAAMMAKLGL